MSESQQNLHGEDVVNRDIIVIKYDGPSFENRMELHPFTKQINSIERILKETVEQLSKSEKIKDEPNEPKFYLQIRKGSFETALLIVFFNPIITNILSDCVFEYLKYLATGTLNQKYTKEIQNLSNNKIIRNSTRNLINPCVETTDKATIINGDVNFHNCNFFELDKIKRDNINNKLHEIEKNLPVESYNQEMFGKILEIDAVKTEDEFGKSKLGFVIDGGSKPVEALFNDAINKDEIKKILFERIKISAVVTYKGEDPVKILIKSYNLTPLKNLKNFMD